MSADLRRRISAAGAGLAWNPKATGIIMVWTEHLRSAIAFDTPGVDTWAINAQGLHINTAWSAKLTAKELEFLICHETLHVGFDHAGLAHELGIADDGYIIPGQEENSRLLGIANDAIINDALLADGLGTMPAGGVLLDDFIEAGYAGPKRSSELYFWLKKNPPPPSGDDGDGDDDDDDDDGGSGSGSSSDASPATGCSPLAYPGKKDESGKRRPLGRTEILAIQATLREASGHQGSAVADLLSSPGSKRTRYKDLIRAGFERASIEACNRMLPSYSRAGRREALDPDELILPGYIGTESRICFCADISGSMLALIPRIMADVLSVSRAYPNAKVYLVAHHVTVCGSAWLRNANDVETIKKTLCQTGGTDFVEAYNHVRAVEAKAGKFDAFIHFTDGETFGAWPEPPGRKAVVALTAGAARVIPKRAQVLYVS